MYEGDFRKDHRWGWGLQRFPDGSSYEGEWYDDLIEGRPVAKQLHKLCDADALQHVCADAVTCQTHNTKRGSALQHCRAGTVQLP